MNRRWRTYAKALIGGIIVMPLTALSLSPEQPQAAKSPSLGQAVSAASRIWKSQTTGKEYRVRIEKDRFYAEWANIPAETVKHGAYIRTECQRLGSKWIGTSRIYLPCTMGPGPDDRIANKCHLTMRFEIGSLTADRIAGRVENPKGFNCERCEVPETEWKEFVWVLKR